MTLLVWRTINPHAHAPQTIVEGRAHRYTPVLLALKKLQTSGYSSICVTTAPCTKRGTRLHREWGSRGGTADSNHIYSLLQRHATARWQPRCQACCNAFVDYASPYLLQDSVFCLRMSVQDLVIPLSCTTGGQELAITGGV